MSWTDNIQRPFIIRTGDGKEYRPLWKNPNFSVEFNATQFNFVDQRGTLVDRREAQGASFPLEFYFVGENCLDDAAAFVESAKDKRAWRVSHPMYGSLVVQPLGINQDDTALNTSKITCTVIETLTEDRPKITIDPVDKISGDKVNTDALYALAFTDGVPKPTTANVVKLGGNNKSLFDLGIKKVKLTVDAQEYFNLFSQANSAIVNLTAEPLAAISQMQTAISYPAHLTDTVQNRIGMLIDQFNVLRLSIGTIITPSDKKIYENNAGTLISSMALASSTPLDTDYVNRTDVGAVRDQVYNNYKLYLSDLDGMQTDNGGTEESYMPDSTALNALNGLINFTLSNLFNIALNARQERTVILEADSNSIVLTHRFYGLDQADTNLQEFIDSNNIGLNQLLEIRKGTKVIYYV